jgi:hypothetical protein
MKRLRDSKAKTREKMGHFEREAKLNVAIILLPILVLIIATIGGPCIFRGLR